MNCKYCYNYFFNKCGNCSNMSNMQQKLDKKKTEKLINLYLDYNEKLNYISIFKKEQVYQRFNEEITNIAMFLNFSNRK